MPARYSYRWANGIATDLANKYGRATDIFCEILDISVKDLAKFLANGDEIFAICRNLIHFMDRIGEGSAWKHEITFYRANLRAFCAGKGIKRIVDRIDTVENSTILKEQAFKAGAGGGQRAEPRLPSDRSSWGFAEWRRQDDIKQLWLSFEPDPAATNE